MHAKDCREEMMMAVKHFREENILSALAHKCSLRPRPILTLEKTKMVKEVSNCEDILKH